MIRLTIKKAILRQIVDGSKKYEYRKLSSYYERIFAKKPKVIRFFFYTSEYVDIKIEGISKSKTPSNLGIMVPTNRCFKIKLGAIIKNTLKDHISF